MWKDYNGGKIILLFSQMELATHKKKSTESINKYFKIMLP